METVTTEKFSSTESVMSKSVTSPKRSIFFMDFICWLKVRRWNTVKLRFSETFQNHPRINVFPTEIQIIQFLLLWTSSS